MGLIMSKIVGSSKPARRNMPTTKPEFTNVFSQFDKNGDGLICHEDLLCATQLLGYDFTADDIDEMIRNVDVDGTDTISFDAFNKWMFEVESRFPTNNNARRNEDVGGEKQDKSVLQRMRELFRPRPKQSNTRDVEAIDLASEDCVRDQGDYYAHLFCAFDVDDDGVISEQDLKCAMKDITGEDLSDEDVHQMIATCDTKGDGVVDLEEFQDMMMYQLNQQGVSI